MTGQKCIVLVSGIGAGYLGAVATTVPTIDAGHGGKLDHV